VSAAAKFRMYTYRTAIDKLQTEKETIDKQNKLPKPFFKIKKYLTCSVNELKHSLTQKLTNTFYIHSTFKSIKNT
jgi:hypothetical protein